MEYLKIRNTVITLFRYYAGCWTQNKKPIILLTLLVFILVLSGCGISTGTPEGNEENINVSEDITDPDTAAAVNKTDSAPALDDSWEWQHDIPENHGLNNEMLERFHTELASTQVLTSVIIKNGYIVDE